MPCDCGRLLVLRSALADPSPRKRLMISVSGVIALWAPSIPQPLWPATGSSPGSSELRLSPPLPLRL
eukprot:8102305-Pyramimonas_sp.AAC.1